MKHSQKDTHFQMVREQPESVSKGGTDVSGGGGLSGDGSEVACKPVAQGAWQP